MRKDDGAGEQRCPTEEPDYAGQMAKVSTPENDRGCRRASDCAGEEKQADYVLPSSHGGRTL
jgi:hypothetical protein